MPYHSAHYLHPDLLTARPIATTRSPHIHELIPIGSCQGSASFRPPVQPFSGKSLNSAYWSTVFGNRRACNKVVTLAKTLSQVLNPRDASLACAHPFANLGANSSSQPDAQFHDQFQLHQEQPFPRSSLYCRLHINGCDFHKLLAIYKFQAEAYSKSAQAQTTIDTGRLEYAARNHTRT